VVNTGRSCLVNITRLCLVKSSTVNASVRHTPESVCDMLRNHCTTCSGFCTMICTRQKKANRCQPKSEYFIPHIPLFLRLAIIYGKEEQYNDGTGYARKLPGLDSRRNKSQFPWSNCAVKETARPFTRGLKKTDSIN